MDPDTERMIRSYIRYRRAPGYAMLWIIVGLFVFFLLIGLLGFVGKLLR